jgi:dipeptidase D
MTISALPEKTAEILDIFSRIDEIPRCSGNEQKIAEWVVSWAAEKGFGHTKDNAGNIVVRVPASPGYEQAPPIILQSHLDMVCEKTPESKHDFACDPIRLGFEGDWLRADGTTLGADNGIGMAVSIALAEDKTVLRPALELLFTVEEETGLTGAQNLNADMLSGHILINIDSEEEGTFTIGCAGGENGHIELPVTREKIPPAHSLCRLSVSGLRGGHSGMNIAENRGNANKILAQTLDALAAEVTFRLVAVEGGTRSNVIPREAEAIVVLPANAFEQAKTNIERSAKMARDKFAETETTLSINLSYYAPPRPAKEAFSSEDSKRCIRLLQKLPHGVHRMSAEMEGLVETSNNLAIVHTEKDVVSILCLQRSSSMSELRNLTSSIGLLAAQNGGRFHRDGLYPGWQPHLDSRLLLHCQEIHRKIHNREAKVTMTHGGLECGILGSKLPKVEMISLGPTIENAHSPQERVHIPSIRTVYDFLAALLGSFPS